MEKGQSGMLLEKLPKQQLRIELGKGTILKKRYKIIKVLAEGGYSIIYLVYDMAERTKKAVKECFPSDRTHRNQVGVNIIWERECDKKRQYHLFEYEAYILERLRDISCVPKFNDYFQENDTCYIVMEFIAGKTLQKIIRQWKRNDIGEYWEIFCSAAKCLEKIHERKIIHRDICLENIIIDSEGYVNIVDFGSAIELGVQDSVIAETTYRQGYSPMEQYSKEGLAGAWTDIYALCATIYYCVLRQLPPVAIDGTDDGNLEFCEQLDLRINPLFAKILKRGLALYPEERWQSVREMFAGIRE